MPGPPFDHFGQGKRILTPDLVGEPRCAHGIAGGIEPMNELGVGASVFARATFTVARQVAQRSRTRTVRSTFTTARCDRKAATTSAARSSWRIPSNLAQAPAAIRFSIGAAIPMAARLQSPPYRRALRATIAHTRSHASAAGPISSCFASVSETWRSAQVDPIISPGIDNTVVSEKPARNDSSAIAIEVASNDLVVVVSDGLPCVRAARGRVRPAAKAKDSQCKEGVEEL